jgi:hypothetical protein
MKPPRGAIGSDSSIFFGEPLVTSQHLGSGNFLKRRFFPLFKRRGKVVVIGERFL